jgi:hypothetical protein
MRIPIRIELLIKLLTGQTFFSLRIGEFQNSLIMCSLSGLENFKTLLSCVLSQDWRISKLADLVFSLRIGEFQNSLIMCSLSGLENF